MSQAISIGSGPLPGAEESLPASCELRSGREGHPTYRAVAQAMHERISAVHPAVGAAMVHVDSTTEPRLERILSEIRTHRKQVAASQADAPPGVSTLG